MKFQGPVINESPGDYLVWVLRVGGVVSSFEAEVDPGSRVLHKHSLTLDVFRLVLLLVVVVVIAPLL
jgi:hypothetical protein